MSYTLLPEHLTEVDTVSALAIGLWPTNLIQATETFEESVYILQFVS